MKISTESYTLSWHSGPAGIVRSPYLKLSDDRGKRWARLCVLSSVHTSHGPDETFDVREPEVRRDGGDLVVTIATESSAWRHRTLEVRCTPSSVELTVVAEGNGAITDVTIGGGDGRLPTGASGTFRSAIDAQSLYVPSPTEPVAFVRPVFAAASLGIVGDAAPGRLLAVFSPPPLVMAFGREAPTGPVEPPEGDWLAASVRADVTQMGFTAFAYEPADGGFLFRMNYEGHTAIDGEWRSPTIVIRRAASAYESIADHRKDLVASGCAPATGPRVEPWWREPLFCGWGAQVARAGGPGSAAGLCRQDIYDEFLAVLRAEELEPGTIVVDDRWQKAYGSAEVDTEAWPDLRGWIAERHAEGRRVLLWWKAWDPAGLPVSECITDAAGRPVAADPGSPAYRERVSAIAERLLGADGLDADGFKVDFTQRAPSGMTLRSAPDSDGRWGIAALHGLLGCIHAAAKRVKSDALVITHTVHPSFGDVSDMIRTNDVLKRDATGRRVSVAEQLRSRCAIVERVLPHHPIDTDQWPMPRHSEWLDYANLQGTLGVPSLYYVERVRNRPISSADLGRIRSSWSSYRQSLKASAFEIAYGVWRIADTCNVYLIIDMDAPAGQRDAVAIDFGSGLVLSSLEGLGVRRITDVLMTHHHRDQGQGLPLAVAHGARIHVPPVEVELFDRVEEMWESRQLDNDYNLRQDRFSLLESVPVHATVPEYRELSLGNITVRVLPTPGHTVGSVTYLLDLGGSVVAFTGDLIYAPGKVWSMAATQWSYTQNEGPAMTVLSALLLQREAPDVLAPSHGDPMPDAVDALGELATNMQEYVDSRRMHPWDLAKRLDDPFIELTPHLLINRTAVSCSYVLLSETGEALVVDYGYDMSTGPISGQDRASRRPWLASLPALKRKYGVTRITVALPTHYHDDHIAGMPLLRDVEGTELWIPENVAPTMADPWREDLPCQWYEAIEADRVLVLDEPFQWNEYEIVAHEQPGHTLYAVAYSLTVDGTRVVFTGDQQEGLGGGGDQRDLMNYQYRNLFRLGDYAKSAALYKRVAPGLMASGHWAPRWVDTEYLDYLVEAAQVVDDVHTRLLPASQLAIGADGQAARIAPYRSRAVCGTPQTFRVSVRNPFPHAVEARVALVLPSDWRSTEPESTPPEATQLLGAGEEAGMEFTVVPMTPGRRQRIAADVTIGDLRLGQHAEAIIDCAPGASPAQTEIPAAQVALDEVVVAHPTTTEIDLVSP